MKDNARVILRRMADRVRIDAAGFQAAVDSLLESAADLEQAIAVASDAEAELMVKVFVHECPNLAACIDGTDVN